MSEGATNLFYYVPLRISVTRDSLMKAAKRNKSIKKQKEREGGRGRKTSKERNRLLRRVRQTPPRRPLRLSFTTEKTMASFSVDFRLFQFRSSTFASGEKRRDTNFPRFVSFFIGSYHWDSLPFLFLLSASALFFLFLLLPVPYLSATDRPAARPSRFPAPLCVHSNKDREGFAGTQKGPRYRTVTAPASMFHVWSAARKCARRFSTNASRHE